MRNGTEERGGRRKVAIINPPPNLLSTSAKTLAQPKNAPNPRWSTASTTSERIITSPPNKKCPTKQNPMNENGIEEKVGKQGGKEEGGRKEEDGGGRKRHGSTPATRNLLLSAAANLTPSLRMRNQRLLGALRTLGNEVAHCKTDWDAEYAFNSPRKLL